MIDTIPPGGHFSDSTVALREDGGYLLTVGTAEFGNGTATVHQQIAATLLSAAAANVSLEQSDTAHGGHDTGAYGSTGTVVAGLATERACAALRDTILDFAARHSGAPREDCKLAGDAVTCAGKRIALADLYAAAAVAGVELSAGGHTDGIRRSVAFNVQGFRVAVNPVSGEIRILKSVQAADAGTVINPMQCRGQVEGGVAQALGAALFEEVVIDGNGRVVNPAFRNYHLPAFADVPRTQVLFADDARHARPARRQVDERKPVQPGVRRARQRPPRRHRRALLQAAVQAGPYFCAARGAQGMILGSNGGPERSRTSDLRFRKPLLYPAELRDRQRVLAHGRRATHRWPAYSAIDGLRERPTIRA